MKLLKAFAFVAAAMAATVLSAEEAEETSGQEEAAQPAAEGGEAVESQAKAKVSDKHFFILPLCEVATGKAEVRQPGETEWSDLVEGRHYALGCTYRTSGAGSKVVMAFGRGCRATIAEGASFGTRMQPLEEKSRTLVLASGLVTLNLPGNLPAGMFVVAAPGFTARDLAGDSTFTFTDKGDGDETLVSCVTGSLALEGRHFKIPLLHPSDALRLRSSGDMLFTGLYATGGKFPVNLEQGLWESRDFETGKTRIDPKTLEFTMSPKRMVRIHRAVPAAGSRMSVTVMTFLEDGKLKNRCAFTENTHSLTTGELGPMSKKEKAELEKKAQKAQEEANKQSGTGEEGGESAGGDGSEAE